MGVLALDTIKIGRTEYEIKSGDYILYNGSCHQFIAGDGRALKYKDFTSHKSLLMPVTLVKKIPFIRMTKITFNRDGIDFIKWYF